MNLKITELQKIVIMDTSCDDEPVMEFIKSNPKQLISQELIVPVWKVIYSYTTNRDNYKEATKYLLRHHADYDVVEIDFEQYIERFNMQHTERKISNVKILDMDFLGKAYIELE